MFVVVKLCGKFGIDRCIQNHHHIMSPILMSGTPLVTPAIHVSNYLCVLCLLFLMMSTIFSLFLHLSLLPSTTYSIILSFPIIHLHLHGFIFMVVLYNVSFIMYSGQNVLMHSHSISTLIFFCIKKSYK